MSEYIDELANEIRRVDGSHSLGAGALSEALHAWLSEHDRLVAERAWDQGRESVAEDMVRPLDESGMRHASTNPYRKQRENNDV